MTVRPCGVALHARSGAHLSMSNVSSCNAMESNACACHSASSHATTRRPDLLGLHSFQGANDARIFAFQGYDEFSSDATDAAAKGPSRSRIFNANATRPVVGWHEAMSAAATFDSSYHDDDHRLRNALARSRRGSNTYVCSTLALYDPSAGCYLRLRTDTMQSICTVQL